MSESDAFLSRAICEETNGMSQGIDLPCKLYFIIDRGVYGCESKCRWYCYDERFSFTFNFVIT